MTEMFVGHYGVSFAAKNAERRIPLWLLFLAVQFLDVLWSIFIVSGIEKARIVPGITATNPLDLYYMPYSHSLPAALFWSAIAGGFFWWLVRRRPNQVKSATAVLLVAAAVFSHWVLDLVVHRPDLPLYDNAHKVGFGLWNYPATAFLLEAACLFAGMWLYLRSTEGRGFGARYGMPIFGAGLLLLQWVLFFGAPPPGPRATAVVLLVCYFGLAGVAGWLEKKRRARPRAIPSV
jgi:membrane-bound metal-dependent hydrolase YbcI (DUF457 family)